MNNLKKYSADLERTLITTPLIRRNKNGTVVLQESILKSRIKKLENLIEKALTPPTSDEVCEALGEELNTTVIYQDETFYNKRTSSVIATIGKMTRRVSVNRKVLKDANKRNKIYDKMVKRLEELDEK